MTGHVYGGNVSGCASSAERLCVFENSNGLVAWGLCERMLIRSSTVSLLPFTPLCYTEIATEARHSYKIVKGRSHTVEKRVRGHTMPRTIIQRMCQPQEAVHT